MTEIRNCLMCKWIEGSACTAPLPIWVTHCGHKIESSGGAVFYACHGAWQVMVDCPAWTEKGE